MNETRPLVGSWSFSLLFLQIDGLISRKTVPKASNWSAVPVVTKSCKDAVVRGAQAQKEPLTHACLEFERSALWL